MAVTVYSRPDCPQCELTKRDMDILGVSYETIDLAQAQDALERFMREGYRSAPVVVTEQGTWSGYDQERIKQLVSYD